MREPRVTKALRCKLQERKAKMKNRLKTAAHSDLQKEKEVERCFMASETCRMGMSSYESMGIPMRYFMPLDGVWRELGVAL